MIHQMFKNMANFMIYFVIFGIAYGISTQELVKKVLENYLSTTSNEPILTPIRRCYIRTSGARVKSFMGLYMCPYFQFMGKYSMANEIHMGTRNL